jgi:large subunit ribosomal protein L7/L12
MAKSGRRALHRIGRDHSKDWKRLNPSAAAEIGASTRRGHGRSGECIDAVDCKTIRAIRGAAMPIPVPVLIAIGVVLLMLADLRLARGRDPLMGKERSPAYRPPRASSGISGVPGAALSPEIEQQARALAAAGRKIEAIKLVREATHLGLKEAKDLVDAME